MRRNLLSILTLLLFLIVTSNQAFSSTVTHKVKQGDNLFSIAKKYHVTVEKLKGLNNLSSTNLKIGQQILVSTDATAPAKTKKTTARIQQEEAEITENDGEFIEYKAKKGDTLDKIALKFNIDKEDILEANNMTGSKRLTPGKIILIPKIIEENEEEIITLSHKSLKPWKDGDEKYMLVKVAKSFMGAPYKYGGESVRGLDCSAFVKKIYDIFDIHLPRSAREQFKTGVQIGKEELAIGDLVFFKTKRYIKYPTHVGIYIGDGNFIHSSSGQKRIGVKIDSLASSFYTRTFVGAIRVKQSFDENAGTTEPTEKTSNNS